jgi:Domain of unknown function (DUF1707)
MSAIDAHSGTRASDADREAAVNELRSHAVAGRLDAAELEQRLDRALQARTRRELAAALANLPAAERPATIPQPTATVGVLLVLAIALWLTGHLGTDALMWAFAGAILYAIWRRPRRAS